MLRLTFTLSLVFAQLPQFAKPTNQLHAVVCVSDLATNLGQCGVSRVLHLTFLIFTQSSTFHCRITSSAEQVRLVISRSYKKIRTNF